MVVITFQYSSFLVIVVLLILQVTTDFDGHNVPTLSMFCLRAFPCLGYLLRPIEVKQERESKAYLRSHC